MLAALQAAAARGARIMSVCTGAFVLAYAGLLDGRRAATHWGWAAALARRFPAVTVDPAVLYVDEGQILTSAGVAAGLDLCLHVIRRDYGADLAARLARRTVVAPHRDGGQAQFIRHPVSAVSGANGSPGLAATRAWALENLGEDLSVAVLARQAGVSARTFARRFREETGTTPRSGCWTSGCWPPASCWSAPGCRSSRSRCAAASAPRPRCASTSPGGWRLPRPPTAARSGWPPRPRDRPDDAARAKGGGRVNSDRARYVVPGCISHITCKRRFSPGMRENGGTVLTVGAAADGLTGSVVTAVRKHCGRRR